MRPGIIRPLATLGVIAIPVVAAAADETDLPSLVTSAQFTGNLANANLGLSNKAAIKTVAARELVVTGADPQWTVTGNVGCRSGATLTKVQAFAGNVVNNNGQLYPIGTWSASAPDTSVAGKAAAQVSLPLTLPVHRTYQGEAVDLSFNPARAFELKLKAFVANGGSAAEYLRITEAFDMDLPIVLAAWCKMGPNSNFLAGQTQAGYVKRIIKATILYEGDQRIVEGIGVRASTQATGGTVAAPQPDPPPRVRAPSGR